MFRTPNEVNELTTGCAQEYNEERPHESLENLTPTGIPEKVSYLAEDPNWTCD
ncbi:MAG: transposase [Pseudomonadales bacterium]|nr:transposase [Pseudomonadales bacterium]